MSDPRSPRLSRRDFVKTVIIGAAGLELGCTAPDRRGGAGSAGQRREFRMNGLAGSEDFGVCHALRDGAGFPTPEPLPGVYDAVIVGGGLSGLVAAFRLRDRNILLLEKEPRVGGNCLRSSWNDIPYSTAASFITGTDAHLVPICQELGIELQALPFPELEYLVDGRRVTDLEAEFARRYPAATGSYEDFRRQVLDIDLWEQRDALDRASFLDYLQGFHPAIRQWHDTLVASMCADAATSSALGGVMMAKFWLGAGFDVFLSRRVDDDTLFGFPGGLGYVSEKLADAVEAAGSGRLLTDATVYRVDGTGADLAEVSYLHEDEPTTVRARAVVVAAPKLIARHLVAGLPEAQRRSMQEIHTTPYLVGALCFPEMPRKELAGAQCLDSVVGAFRVRTGGAGGAEPGDPGARAPGLIRFTIPRRSDQRQQLLERDGVEALAQEAVDFFEAHDPGLRDAASVVRIHRRGHNWFLPVPGLQSVVQPRASRRLGRVVFAHADRLGPISDSDWATLAAERAVREADSLMSVSTAGKRRLASLPSYPS